MKKSQWTLFIIVLAMIGSTAGFLLKVKGHQKLGEPGVRLGDVPLFDEQTNEVANVSVILPENVSGFLSTPLPISDIELRTLPKDTTFGKRRYWTTNGANVDLSVIVMGQDRTSLHKPDFCMPGQGWTIEQRELLKIKMERPHAYDLPVMKLTASTRLKDDAGNPFVVRGIYVYWFAADNKLAATDERMWSMMKNFLQTGTLERWAYISYFSSCFPGQEEETYQRLQQLIAASVPEFQLAAGKPSQASAPTQLQTAFK